MGRQSTMLINKTRAKSKIRKPKEREGAEKERGKERQSQEKRNSLGIRQENNP